MDYTQLHTKVINWGYLAPQLGGLATDQNYQSKVHGWGNHV